MAQSKIGKAQTAANNRQLEIMQKLTKQNEQKRTTAKRTSKTRRK